MTLPDGRSGPGATGSANGRRRCPSPTADQNIKPQYVVEKLHQLTGGRAIIATEVGQNQMWAAQFYRFDEPNAFITSGGLGAMGFGLPAAIGAQVACPDRTVVDVAGDGIIQMNIQEMAPWSITGCP